jgi:hypothetical protein
VLRRSGGTVIAGAQCWLVDAGVLEIPYMMTFVYLGIVLVAGYRLSADILRAAELARRLAASEFVTNVLRISLPANTAFPDRLHGVRSRAISPKK